MSIPYIDIHTHHPVYSDEVISIPSFFLQDISTFKSLSDKFSAGIHPWHSDRFKLDEIKCWLNNLVDQPGLFAIGEAGLDKKCQVDIDSQNRVFNLHIEFARKINKPLIIHCVNSWNEIISYAKKSDQAFILHGYHGNVELTRQLIRHGFYFSIGNSILKENSKSRESIQIIPVTSLFFETDDDILDIKEIYTTAASVIGCSVGELKAQVFENYNSIIKKQD